MKKIRNAGFVLGIVGCALFLFFLYVLIKGVFTTENDFVRFQMFVWFLPLGASVVSLIFSCISKKQEGGGLNTAGFVLGLVGIVLSSILFIASFFVITMP